ncbi:hypothetical protein BGW36DRAFT_431049 [Talaromyces proteolyticus]|uniref:Uncharacterized protein n=1 Tax=Talaromyces proteolyticus TaxID=1131652 RepID=A0AAD4PWA6_9EURO|nr:uncharacterized protein BGW36DRAFT_431049 [Talaromyces proteolyticus]KAH8691797.1 hypothetical protein BGW36DRAFT_431049 [Talaromyces proteolyticus]
MAGRLSITDSSRRGRESSPNSSNSPAKRICIDNRDSSPSTTSTQLPITVFRGTTFTLEMFDSLSKPARENQFRYMQETLSKYEYLSKSLPRVDMMLFEQAEDRLSKDEQERAADQMNDIHEKWKFERLVGQQENKQYRVIISWDDDRLHWMPEESLFRTCGKLCGWETHGLYLHISSQLLMFRLTLLFGMPPVENTVGYKVGWDIRILHLDNQISTEALMQNNMPRYTLCLIFLYWCLYSEDGEAFADQGDLFLEANIGSIFEPLEAMSKK